jgi:hypothetical protein
MWARFTERARRSVFFAQEAAGEMGENHVSTEHLLLGLIRDGDFISVKVLEVLGVPIEGVRSAIESQAGRGDGRSGPDMHLTPRAKRVIDLAYDEARQLDNKYIGTEHLLLGLIREAEGLAGRVLIQRFGIDLESARRVIMHMQSATSATTERATGLPHARLEERLQVMRERNATTSRTAPGDLGEARAAEGHSMIEMATDVAAFRALEAAYQARDRHAYRALTAGVDGDNAAVVRLSAGTPLKALLPPPGETEVPGGQYVRVLGGPFEGRAGWIFDAAFTRLGPDDAPFPPEE